MGYTSCKIELFITSYQKGCLVYTQSFSHLANIVSVHFFECFCMQLSLQAKLSLLIAAQNKYISISIN